MKNTILASLTVLLVGLPAGAAHSVFGVCMTEVAPSTTFAFNTDDKEVEMNIIHHNGIQYAPFWNSLVVPNDMTTLTEKADLIKKLDQVMIVKWKKELCDFKGDSIFSCVGNAEPVVMNGMKIEPWAVYSSTIVEKSFAGEYEYVEMGFRFYIDGQAHNMMMKYQKHECDLSQEKKKDTDKKIQKANRA